MENKLWIDSKRVFEISSEKNGGSESSEYSSRDWELSFIMGY